MFKPEPDDVCPLCHESLDGFLCTFPCRHVYCEQCANDLRLAKAVCPSCRAPLVAPIAPDSVVADDLAAPLSEPAMEVDLAVIEESFSALQVSTPLPESSMDTDMAAVEESILTLHISESRPRKTLHITNPNTNGFIPLEIDAAIHGAEEARIVSVAQNVQRGQLPGDPTCLAKYGDTCTLNGRPLFSCLPPPVYRCQLHWNTKDAFHVFQEQGTIASTSAGSSELRVLVTDVPFQGSELHKFAVKFSAYTSVIAAGLLTNKECALTEMLPFSLANPYFGTRYPSLAKTFGRFELKFTLDMGRRTCKIVLSGRDEPVVLMDSLPEQVWLACVMADSGFARSYCTIVTDI